MKISEQIDKFENHKEFCNNELKWTENQKDNIMKLPEVTSGDRNTYLVLKRLVETGDILHIKKLDKKENKKDFIPNFFFFELASELEQIEIDIKKCRQFNEIESFEDLFNKVLEYYDAQIEILSKNLSLNGIDINLNQIETIKTCSYTGQNALEVVFFCPKKIKCQETDKKNTDGLCPRQNIWKHLLMHVFEKIRPYIPEVNVTFRPRNMLEGDDCSIIAIYKVFRRSIDDLDVGI